MLVKWYEAGGVEIRPETYEVPSWVFIIKNATVTALLGQILQIPFGNSGIRGEN